MRIIKLDLLTNVTIVDNEIRFVSDKQQHSSAEIKLSNDSNDIVELNKRIVSVRENEELMATINQVF